MKIRNPLLSSIARRTCIVIAACCALWMFGGATIDSGGRRWLVVWRVGSEQFSCYLERPVDAARVRIAIRDHTTAGIPLGRVKHCSAENTGHTWHLENTRLVELTVEIYDGRPSDIDLMSTGG